MVEQPHKPVLSLPNSRQFCLPVGDVVAVIMRGEERKGEERKGEERKREERNRGERTGTERRGNERGGKERHREERRGKREDARGAYLMRPSSM